MILKQSPRAAKAPPKDHEPIVYPQLACCVCGELVDEPAALACRCGQYVTCYKSGCVLKVPTEHRDGHCAKAARLLADLRGQGFALRAGADGKLLVSPSSKLTPEQREGIKAERDEMLAILAWESVLAAPEKTIRDWIRGK